MAKRHIIDFSKLDKEDLESIGKSAYLLSELKYLKISIPDGFIVTTSFFEDFLEQTGIQAKITKIRKLNHPAIEDSIEKLLTPVKKEMLYAAIPQNLAIKIYNSYKKLSGVFKEPSLRVFSSTHSNKSVIFPNVKGDANLILKIKRIWSFYLENAVTIVVQKNIDSKIKGKIFTDDFSRDKLNFLTEDQISQLKVYAQKIQKHFYFPQELDYALVKEKIYITNVTPLTNVSKKQEIFFSNKKIRKVLVRGISLNPGIVTGKTIILKDQNVTRIKNGEIVVLPKLNAPIWPEIKKAKAIVVDSLLSKGHDRMIYRKHLQFPIIHDARNATKVIQNGSIITVNGMTGDIYQGGL